MRYFVALAEEGSVTRAAERLGIQQPPLSQQLRALEEEIGTPLFKRSSRGIQLTEAGSTLLDGARKILDMFDRTLDDTRRCGRGQHERISIGYTNSGAFNDFVPQTIRTFRQKFPDVSVALDESCTAELLDALRAQRVDVAFVRGAAPNIKGLTILPLIDEEMVVAVPNSHWLATSEHRSGVSLEALSAETFLMYRRSVGPGLYDVIVNACARAGFAPRIGQEAPRMVGTLNLVAAGLGITLVPMSMQRLNSQSVTYVPLRNDFDLRAPIQLAFRTGDISPVARLFADMVSNLAAGNPVDLTPAAAVDDDNAVAGSDSEKSGLQKDEMDVRLAVSR